MANSERLISREEVEKLVSERSDLLSCQKRTLIEGISALSDERETPDELTLNEASMGVDAALWGLFGLTFGQLENPEQNAILQRLRDYGINVNGSEPCLYNPST